MALKLNWCLTCGHGRNFGDQLGPVLLRHFGYDVEWAPPAMAEVISVGSILSKVPGGWRGTVLGSGLIDRKMRRDIRHARVLALRGELTRRHVQVHGRPALGDLGVLVCDLPRDDAEHVAELAVPHYVDHDLIARHPRAATASVLSEPCRLLGAIASARLVITSSLHVLIAADALGVPHVLEPCDRVIGGTWKFDDYASAFGERIVPGQVRLTPHAAMVAKQAELRALVTNLDITKPAAHHPS